MKRLEAGDIKDLNLLKHYRIIRKWACKNNGLNDADLELLIYLDCIDFFTIDDFNLVNKAIISKLKNKYSDTREKFQIILIS